ncbi:hypothetical protein, partial [Helicobacter typhlonius]|uniref:hypothetical protein n=1 Tax=Helicobacter typhlonius TaxID=76936 RepID=UPI002FE32565
GGGGIGLKLNNINNVLLNDCKFENNCAKQDKSQSRPTLSEDPLYYNGDGGAIQIGYYRESENMVVSFYECNFIKNKAQRHGGAISIQTLKDITINDCTFTKNEANIDSNSMYF